MKSVPGSTAPTATMNAPGCWNSLRFRTMKGRAATATSWGPPWSTWNLYGARELRPRFAPQAISAGSGSASALPLRLHSQVIASSS
jgi:hypothetical protein